jgi:hypothetical protein
MGTAVEHYEVFSLARALHKEAPMTRTSMAFLLAFLTPAAAHAAQVAMVPVQCTNLSEGECDAVGAVFAGAFSTASGAQVVGVPGQPAEAMPYAPPAGSSEAMAGIDRLTVWATRLTSRIALRASLQRPDGAPIHAVEMMATTLDDLPPAADRMSRALVNRTSVDQTMNLRNITRTEGKQANRTTTEKIMGMKTALVMPFASGVDLDPMLALQFDGRFEFERYFLEIGAGAMLPSDSSERRGYGGVFAEFGASAYLGADGSPLYVGGGFVPRIYGSSGDGGVRAAVYGQTGLMFMRTSSTRLYAEVRLSQNVIPMAFRGQYVPTTSPNYTSTVSSDKSVYPTELGLQVGIGW